MKIQKYRELQPNYTYGYISGYKIEPAKKLIIEIKDIIRAMIIVVGLVAGISYYTQPQPELLSPCPESGCVFNFGVQAEEPEVIPEYKLAHVTAYSCGGLKTKKEILMNCPSLLSGEPKTANGTTPIAGKTMACDKANMGRKFELIIDGDPQVWICTDTGGAIKGAGRFDLYVEDVGEAWKFGRRTDIQYRLLE